MFSSYMYMVKTFLKVLWWQVLIPRSEPLLLAVQLYCVETKYFNYVNVSIL